jgi:hypothetical protein
VELRAVEQRVEKLRVEKLRAVDTGTAGHGPTVSA